MNIFIAGGGRVGFHLARLLCAEGRDVTLLDRNPQRREEIDFELDARTVVGDCTSVLLLQSLNAGDADLFIACTGDDRSNLIAATVAKGLGAGRAVARVDTTDFIESSFLYEGFMNVDYLLSPDALAAHDIVQFVENPGVL
ncbi:MAG TPA: NAD-binding protein, partial [Candidatus Hydrogenedentes bacterium]|nr:NAD-binding protein [Candidatus Hydrogenedentota bacterium]